MSALQNDKKTVAAGKVWTTTADGAGWVDASVGGGASMVHQRFEVPYTGERIILTTAFEHPLEDGDRTVIRYSFFNTRTKFAFRPGFKCNSIIFHNTSGTTINVNANEQWVVCEYEAYDGYITARQSSTTQNQLSNYANITNMYPITLPVSGIYTSFDAEGDVDAIVVDVFSTKRMVID